MKKALYLLLILTIVGLSYLKFKAIGETSSPSPLPSDPPVVVEQKSDEALLTTKYFTLSYPKTAQQNPPSESPDSILWSITYMGAKQVASGRTQTELFDGYALTITVFPEIVGTDPALVQAKADRQGIVDGCGDTNVTKLESTEIAGYQAISFTGGCLGEAIHYYFANQGILYRLTTMIVGDQADIAEYQKTTDRIIRSFKLLN